MKIVTGIRLFAVEAPINQHFCDEQFINKNNCLLISGSSFRRSDSRLPHILASTLLISHLTLLIRLIEQHLRDSFISVNLGR